MAYTPDRDMTVKRGMTRLKTIKAQFSSDVSLLSDYGAWCSMKKHPLGISKNDTTTVTIKQTIDKARETVQKTYQQAEDLIEEYTTILTALARTNLVTKITVAGLTMTVYEAIAYQKFARKFKNDLINANAHAVKKAEITANSFNSNVPENQDGTRNLADVVYFMDTAKLQEYRQFDIQFMDELNGVLDESNAVTKLIFDDLIAPESEV